MRMKRKSRNRRETIERMLLSREITRLRSDDQYLNSKRSVRFSSYIVRHSNSLDSHECAVRSRPNGTATFSVMRWKCQSVELDMI